MRTNLFSATFSLIGRTPWRSVSIVLTVSLIAFVMILFLFLEKNARQAISYYEYSPLDEKRFTITAKSDIFSLFSRGAQGIDTGMIRSISLDDRIQKYLSFTLVEIPILAKFHFFKFSLETDMPVFAVSDNALTGSDTPIGISQILLDFYNSEFALSSPYFPKFDKELIIGQNVVLTFGQSKLFAPIGSGSSVVRGEIVSISHDFPGFGLVVPNKIVEKELDILGVKLGNPYKIIGYMKDPKDKENIRTRYGENYSMSFDQEDIEEVKNKTSLMRKILSFVGGGLFCIGISIFLLLFSGYMRERTDIYETFSILGIRNLRSNIILLAEPLFLIFLSLAGSYFLFLFLEPLMKSFFLEILISRGIDFPVVGLSLGESFFPLFLIGLLISCIIFIFHIQKQKRIIH